MVLSDRNPLPESEIQEIQVDEFKVPPHGNSKEEEFDLLGQIDIDPEEEEAAVVEDGEAKEEEKDAEAIEVPPFLKTVPNIEKFWLNTSPSKQDYYSVLTGCF